MKTIPKSKLKEGYYWEFADLYDSLPDELTVPTYEEHVFTETISHNDILKTYVKKMFTIEEAFAVALDYAQSAKKDFRIIYFEHNSVPCRLVVWRGDDGKLHLDVYQVYLDGKWSAGNGVLCSNENLDPLPAETLSPSDTLTIERAIGICVMNGYQVTKHV